MKYLKLAYYILPLGLFLIVASPNLFTDGMFMDGIIYATIARNMSMDIGSFWVPKLSETFFLEFYEHPPLGIGMESLFYTVLGDHFWVERLYSFSTFLVTSVVMVFIWKKVSLEKYRSLSWLALFLLLPLPIISWSASSNLLENTMMIFSSLSILYLVQSLNNRKRFRNLLMGSFWLLAAFFCKGPVSLFPLAFFFWVLIFRSDYSFRRFLEDTVVLGFMSLCLLALVFIVFPDSTSFLQQYYLHQIVDSFENAVTVSSRFHILERLLMEFLPAIILSIVIAVSYKKIDKDSRVNSWAYIFIGVGLSAVLPIMVSLKQRGFYILPALPILAIALSLLVAPKMSLLVERIESRRALSFIVPIIAGIALLVGIILNVNNFGKVGRDKEKLSDVYALAKKLPAGTILGTSDEVNQDYGLKSYLYRYGFLSLSIEEEMKNDFLLLEKDDQLYDLGGYKLESDSLNLYNLYKRHPKRYY